MPIQKKMWKQWKDKSRNLSYFFVILLLHNDRKEDSTWKSSLDCHMIYNLFFFSYSFISKGDVHFQYLFNFIASLDELIKKFLQRLFFSLSVKRKERFFFWCWDNWRQWGTFWNDKKENFFFSAKKYLNLFHFVTF